LALASPVLSAVSCFLSNPIVLDKDGYVELQQYVNEYEGTFTMKMTYYGQAYVSIGVNENGNARMKPATAIIGRADGGTPSVDKYTISNYNGVDLTTNDGLYNASFVQTTDSSVLTFTQSLDQFAQISIADDTQWIYAVGREGNSFGRHALEGSFQLPLTSTCSVVATPAPTEAPVVTPTTNTPTSAGNTPTSDNTSETDEGETESEAEDEDNSFDDDSDETEAETPTSTTGSQAPAQGTASDEVTPSCTFADPIVVDQNGELELQQFSNPELGTYTIKLTYSGGQAWLGVGINQNGVPKMSPSTVVIGRADGDNPTVLKYGMTGGTMVELLDSSLQTLLNASFVQTDSVSTLTYTGYLSESGQTPISDSTQWIYAVGFSDNRWNGHAMQGGFKLSLTPTCQNTASSATQSGIVFANIAEPDRQMWRTHGILMAIAWGLCAPLAIGASILRTSFARLGISNDKGLWFKIHLYMNIGTTLLTLAGFIVAVAAKKQQGVENFETTHAKFGLAIFTMVLAQGIAGFLRPGLPKPKSSSTSIGDEESDPNHMKKDSLDDNNTERDPSSPMHATIETSSPARPENSKTKVRVAWEWGHRLLGLGLLAMAWYNCHTGIVYASTLWDESFDNAAAFWGVVGGLTSFIVVARVILQLTE